MQESGSPPKNKQSTSKQVRDSQKVHVWCNALHDSGIKPHNFLESTEKANINLNILKNFAYPQMKALQLQITKFNEKMSLP